MNYGVSLASKGLKLHNSKIISHSKDKDLSDGIQCSHCGGTKHTLEIYFKLHNYQDWWIDFQS